MSDNALAAVIDVQEGLSIVRCSNIENVLLVEGKTDAEFYKNFSKKKIHYGSKGETCAIKDIIEDKINSGKSVYGIIDNDYKEENEMQSETEKIKDFVFITDAHSLETMIIKHVGIDIFEKTIRRKILTNTYFVKTDFTRDSLKWAFSIGCLRKSSVKKNWGLPINHVVENHDYLKGYLMPNKSEGYDFNLDAFLNDLLSVSSRTKISKRTLKNSIEGYSEDKAWFICRGHDIFDFIDALYRTIKGKRNLRECHVPSWEYTLLTSERDRIISKFENSKLKEFFDRINRKDTTSNPI